MKKMKKLAALVLAMVMAFSLMAVTAAAYGEEHVHTAVCEDDGIIARKPGYWCPECLGPASYYVVPGGGSGGKDLYVFDCPKCGVVRVTN